MLVTDFFLYHLITITMVDKIADDGGTDKGFLYHILPNAIAYGIEFLAVLVEQTSTNLLVFFVWRDE